MKKIPPAVRDLTCRQIDSIILNKISPDHHIPVLLYIKSCVQRDLEIYEDALFILAAYRGYLRGAHLLTTNRKTFAGKKKSLETRQKMSAAKRKSK
jgi:hypothetical protein